MDHRAEDPRSRVALACRVLHMAGQDHFLLGHVSVRADGERMLVKAFGVGLGETTPDDVVLCDLEGRQVEGRPQALPNERHLHAGIYRHRPDVAAVVHTHPIATSAFAATDAPFLMVSQDSLFFRGRLARYDSPALVSTPEAGDALARALGTGRLVVLRNHGLAAADATLESAVFLALAFERSLEVQARAGRFGPPAEIPGPVADRMAAEFEAGYAARVAGTWAYLVRRVEERRAP